MRQDHRRGGAVKTQRRFDLRTQIERRCDTKVARGIGLLLVALIAFQFLGVGVAAATQHTVVKGDSMWGIAVKYQVGLSELKEANPHIANPHLIYPGQVLTIPTLSATVDAYEREVVRLVNIERTNRGLQPLTSDWQLARVARYKSQDMKQQGYFSHTSPVYGSPFQMMKNFGITYRSAGENIARGYTTPQAVVTGWMNSSGHRANILNAKFTHIGVGYVEGGHYWTQMFIAK